MLADLSNIIKCPLALLGGGVLGVAFGRLQKSARQRYEKLQQAGALRSEWVVVRGSSRRVIVLLIALGLAQVLCPFLFTAGGQWWFSGGVVAGYAVVLYRQFRLRKAAAG